MVVNCYVNHRHQYFGLSPLCMTFPSNLKINKLVKDIERNGLSEGIGKPEPLRYRKGWSRRIDEKNRLVYDIDESGDILIASCRGHYEY